jgi:hypothetical protein
MAGLRDRVTVLTRRVPCAARYVWFPARSVSISHQMDARLPLVAADCRPVSVSVTMQTESQRRQLLLRVAVLSKAHEQKSCNARVLHDDECYSRHRAGSEVFLSYVVYVALM